MYKVTYYQLKANKTGFELIEKYFQTETEARDFYNLIWKTDKPELTLNGKLIARQGHVHGELARK